MPSEVLWGFVYVPTYISCADKRGAKAKKERILVIVSNVSGSAEIPSRTRSVGSVGAVANMVANPITDFYETNCAFERTY